MKPQICVYVQKLNFIAVYIFYFQNTVWRRFVVGRTTISLVSEKKYTVM
jgi:hypothetical protein